MRSLKNNEWPLSQKETGSVKPTIEIPNTTTNRKDAESVAEVLNKALDVMPEEVWGKKCSDVKIRILNPGINDFETSAASLITVFDIDETCKDAIVQREPGTFTEILISSDFFKTGAGGRLVELGASRFLDRGRERRILEVAIHFLAHESHHIDEVERMGSCGILFNQRETHFAGAARDDFPEDWKDALRSLACEYPTPEKIPDSLVTASHIVNEAAADLVGIYWLRKIPKFESTWKSFLQRLIQFRRGEREISLAAGKLEPAYDIADAIETIVESGISHINEIYEKTWELCREAILQNSDECREVSGKFSHEKLSKLTLPVVEAKQVDSGNAGSSHGKEIRP
jgi:hypothetical protein